ncbi:MAG: putative toxin-antitoxin system toxin component, PIN family [Betaproteobacteria bacterium]
MNSARTKGPGPEPAAARARVVIDTNAVLDLWAFADARVQGLRAALQAGELEWVGTPGMRLELQHVLARGVGAAYGAAPEAVLAHWDRWARLWPQTEPRPSQHRLRCRDADDQKFLDLALESQSQWLLTSDRDLLSLSRHAARLGVRICSPQAWTDEKEPPRPEGGGGLDGRGAGV